MWYKLILLLTPILVLYYRILYEMGLDWWHDENYSHGFLIPFVSGYLIIQKLDELKKTSIKPSWWGPLVLSLGLLLLIIGVAGAELFTMRFSFLVVLTGLTLSMFGIEFLRKLFFPLFFLIFMVPLPYIVYNSLTLPLRTIASQLATFFLSFLNIPVLREGNVIHLPQMTMQVVEACSGIRSLISLLALSTIFAYFTQNKSWSRVLLVGFTIPIAIFTNAIRITLTGVLAAYVSPELAHGFFHNFSGWLIFLVAFLLLGGLSWGLNKITRRYER